MSNFHSACCWSTIHLYIKPSMFHATLKILSFFKAVLWSLHWTIGISYKKFKCYKKLCICMCLIPVHQRSVSFLTKIKALFWLILNFKPPQEVTELLCSFKNCIALRFCYNLDPNWCHIIVLLIGQGHICIKTFLTYILWNL